MKLEEIDFIHNPCSQLQTDNQKAGAFRLPYFSNAMDLKRTLYLVGVIPFITLLTFAYLIGDGKTKLNNRSDTVLISNRHLYKIKFSPDCKTRIKHHCINKKDVEFIIYRKNESNQEIYIELID